MLFFFLKVFCLSFGMGVNLEKMVVNFSLYCMGLGKSDQKSLNLPLNLHASLNLLLLPHFLTSPPPSHSPSPPSLSHLVASLSLSLAYLSASLSSPPLNLSLVSLSSMSLSLSLSHDLTSASPRMRPAASSSRAPKLLPLLVASLSWRKTTRSLCGRDHHHRDLYQLLRRQHQTQTMGTLISIWRIFSSILDDYWGFQFQFQSD